jgi:hypothetical protein
MEMKEKVVGVKVCLLLLMGTEGWPDILGGREGTEPRDRTHA